MKKFTISLFTVIMMVALFFSGSAFAANSDVGVTYRAHIQNIGWSQGWVSNGTMAGTSGQSLRLEATEINLVNAPTNAKINYFVHVQNIGDQKPDRFNGQLAGTEGMSLRLEAIHITLENMPGYSVMYRVHVQDIGWQEWVSDGAIAGTTGQSLRLEGLEIKIVKLADLTAYNAALAAVTEDQVKSGWAEYQAVVNANVVTVNNTQAEVDLATMNIVNAQAKLVLFANMDAYNAALAAATEDNFTTDSWKLYQVVVLTNVVTRDNTQAQVDTATANILAAQKNLVAAADLTAFNDAVSIYVAMGGDNSSGVYTNRTWDDYAWAVNKWACFNHDGVWVSSITKDSAQVTVDFAAAQIADKKAKLVMTLDYTAYHEAILPITNDNSDPITGRRVYTEQSFYHFVRATEVYRNLAETTKLQSDVDFATGMILGLQSDLVAIDRTLFDAAMEAYLVLEPNADNYSSNTWCAYQAAFDAGVAVDNNKRSDQADYDTATANLLAAQDNLVVNAVVVVQSITKDSIGPVFVGSNVLTIAQNIVDQAYGDGFVVTIESQNRAVINNDGLVRAGGYADVKFHVTEIADPSNAGAVIRGFDVPAV
ncbi:Ig domain-containing protein [Acetobacterium bakii]|uniref:Ig domain-containing protein n=1 Tax=Acetobacterium bakii TaxID=52689 RepID=UPI00067F9900|nr:Ig domain-containing protein [Acetobacterium bakii]